MKKILGLSLLVLTLMTACNKDESCKLSAPSTVAPASEIQAVKDYLNSKSITATQDPSGVFYVMTAPGSGTASPTICSTINFKYKGSLTNGNVFDNSGTTAVSYPLGNLIVGWQKVIPLMKKGGKATLYIPPSLGYGPNDLKDGSGNVVIPGNSILIFDIELVNF